MKDNSKTQSEESSSNLMRMLIASVAALVTLGGITFTLMKERMDTQQLQASADIATLREEIKATKSDAKDLVNTAAAAAKDAVANSATALRESVSATAAANKDSVKASADALQSAVLATGIASKEAVAATASNLNDKIERLNDDLVAMQINGTLKAVAETTALRTTIEAQQKQIDGLKAIQSLQERVLSLETKQEVRVTTPKSDQ